jgi:hypothetical protein
MHEHRCTQGHVYGMIRYSKLNLGPSDPSWLLPFRASGQRRATAARDVPISVSRTVAP